jgi:hypothetical protein
MFSVYPASSLRSEAEVMSTRSTEATAASDVASTTATWGPHTAPTEIPSFFLESNDGQSSDLTPEKKGGGGRGGSGGKGGKGGKGGNGGHTTTLSTTPLGGRWRNNFYPTRSRLPVAGGSPAGEDFDVYEALKSIIADAKEQLGTVSDEENKYRDFMNMLNQLLEQAKDRKNWVDVAEKYNEYVAELNDEINAVRSGTAVSHKSNLPFTKIALAAAGTFGMLYGSF